MCIEGTRSFRLLLSCMLLSFLFPAIAQAEPEVAKHQVTLQLKWTNAFQFAGYYTAKEKGYYRESGISVAIKELQLGMDPVREVVEGRAEYGLSSSDLVVHRAKGAPVVVLGVVFQHSALALVALKRGLGQTVHDLAGKRIMLVPGAAEMRAYLKKEGIEPGQYEVQDHSFELVDLISGKTDAFSAYTTDQTYRLERAGIPYVGFSPRSSGIDFYGDNLFTSEEEIRRYPDRVEAFRKASFRGWTYAMEHPEEIVDLILAKYPSEHDRASLLYEAKKMVPLIQSSLVELGYMHPGRWRHIVETYAEIGMLSTKPSLEGFLYVTEPEARLRWPYRLMLLAALGLAIIGFIALRFYRLSKRLRSDIVRRKKAEAEKLVLEEQLLHAQKMDALGTLASGVAHDMNNILAVVLGLGAVLQDEIDPEDPKHDDIVDIVSAAERGKALVENLLGFARKGNYAPSQWSSKEGICRLQTILEKVIQKSVVIETDLKGTRSVHCDQNQIITALMNLCINSAQAIESAGTIRIVTEDLTLADGQTLYPDAISGSYLKIEVQDDGRGMEDTTRKRAFDPFFTTKDIGEGTGLGLSMVHGVIAHHGGSVGIESTVGQGTTITILLPAFEFGDSAASQAAPGN